MKDQSIRICLCRALNLNVTRDHGGWTSTQIGTDGQKTVVSIDEIKRSELSAGFLVFAKTLNQSKINNLQSYIEISHIKIYDQDKINIEHANDVLKLCENFHVAYVVTRSMLNKSKEILVQSMLSLQDQCVFVCPCLSTKRPPAPVDFPCQMAIAVGCKVSEGDKNAEDKPAKDGNTTNDKADGTAKNKVDYQSCGSALDFVCHRQYGDIKINTPWEASYFVTAITALILVKAYALGECNSELIKTSMNKNNMTHDEIIFISCI